MRKGLIFLVVVSCLLRCSMAQSEECEKFVEQLVENIMKLNISSIPLPSIMYSGITTNNPGQFYECQQANFSYYLVTIKNTTTNINTFTGICVPNICSREDMQIALDFWDCKVYDFPGPEESSTDALAVIGIVILSLWMAVLAIWSIFISCREPEVNEYVQKEKQENSVNSLVTSLNKEDSNKSESFHIFNYYEGYCRIFKKPKRKNVMGSFLFLAALSALISTELSYKQAISSNPSKSYEFFNSFWGIFVCNVEIAFSVIMFVLGMRLAYSCYKLTTFHEVGRFFFDHLLKKWAFLLIITLSIYGFMSYTDEPLSKYWSVNFGEQCPSHMWQTWFLFRHLQIDTKVCLPWLWIPEAEIFLTLISAPFIIIFRIKKNLGYGLISLLCLISLVVGFSVLDGQGVVFEPTKLFNMQKEYTISYQTNTIVRAGAFYFGLVFGLFVLEGLEKMEGKGKTAEYKLAKKIRRESTIQYTLQGVGLFLMLLVYFLLAEFLELPDESESQTGAHWFVAFTPTVFLVGLAAFILPSFWLVETGVAHLVNSFFGWQGWSSLEKITPCMLAVGPAIMGFTTFSTQNNIYYDLETVTVYLLGNLLLTYVFSLIVCAAVENQIVFLGNYLQTRVFGKENKYSVLMLQE